jgi:predicted nucleic acid-binding protein
MKSTEVCVDASLAIKVVVPEAGSDRADALFNQWADEETQLIAPMFFEVETDSILRQKASLRRELTADQAQRAFASLPIKTRHSAEQRDRAWEIASEFQFPTVYDATYLALAELSQCEFWTADEKLFKQVRDKLTFVHGSETILR